MGPNIIRILFRICTIYHVYYLLCRNGGCYFQWLSLRDHNYARGFMESGPEVIKLFSSSAQLRLKFVLLRNVKMPTIVGILTLISRINYRLC